MLPASTRAPWAVETVGEAAPVPEAVQGLMLAEARRAAAEASSGPLTKRINDQRSLQRWKKSEAHANILKYISELGDAVVGRRLTQECEARPIISTIVAELEAMSEWIDRIPPLQQAMRYGNKAFKTWHERLVERSHKMMSDIFERHGPACVEDTALAAAELHTYFIESFGSPVRVDYGTGHELSLIAWLFCMEKVGLLVLSDRPAVVLRVFHGYLTLMQKLQTTYWLEPAGSHGVWGLDDYQFLCFIFGAAQLVNHPHILPSSIHDEELLEQAADDYMYLSAIAFIRKVKKGPFGEHSPYLNDISGVETWNKVVAGLLRMYEGEVLGKLPVVQHLKFGTLLKWDSEFKD